MGVGNGRAALLCPALGVCELKLMKRIGQLHESNSLGAWDARGEPPIKQGFLFLNELSCSWSVLTPLHRWQCLSVPVAAEYLAK